MSSDSYHLKAEVEQAIRGAATLAMQGVDLGKLSNVIEEIRDSARNIFENALVARLRARNARIVACCSLPNELWTATWSLLPLEDRFSVSRVCHSWRTIALSSPTLWTEIYLPCKIKDVPDDTFWECTRCLEQEKKPKQYVSSLHYLEPMLLRSGALPVCIRVSNLNYGTHMEFVDHLASVLNRHSSRIKELHISSVTCQEFIPELLTLLSLPALRKLSAVCTHVRDGSEGEPLCLHELASPELEELSISAGFEWNLEPGERDAVPIMPHLRDLSIAVYDPAQLTGALKACPGLISLRIYSHWSEDSNDEWETSTLSRLATIPSIYLEDMSSDFELWLAQTFEHAPATNIRVIYGSETPTSDAFLVLKSFTAPVQVTCSTLITAGSEDEDEDEEWLVLELRDDSRTIAYQWPYGDCLDEIPWNALPVASIASLDVETSLLQDLIFSLRNALSIQSVTLRFFSTDDLDDMLSPGLRLRFPNVQELHLYGPPAGIHLTASHVVLIVETFGFGRLRTLEMKQVILEEGLHDLAELADEVRYDSR